MGGLSDLMVDRPASSDVLKGDKVVVEILKVAAFRSASSLLVTATNMVVCS